MHVNRARLRQQLIENRDEISRILHDDPALVEYLLSDVELKRKYVKLPDQVELELQKKSQELGLGEGVLLFLGAIMLLGILADVTGNSGR